jgi:fibronectin-binding autotransporter adhesin
MKRKSKVISAVLGLVMLVSLVVLPMSAGAVGDYEVKTTDTLAAIQTQVDAGNSLHFAAGTYSYTGTLTIGTGDIAIKTDSGASVTFNAAGQQTEAVINQTAPEGSVTFSGQGTVTLDGTNNAQGNYYARGIECAGSLSLTGGTLDISNFGGWGISGAQADGTFSMTGGELDITDCGWYDEGGFIWSDAGCSFTAGTLNLTDNGTVVAGSLVSQGTITFGSDAPDAQPMTAQLANYDSGADSITDTITAAGALTIRCPAVLSARNGTRNTATISSPAPNTGSTPSTASWLRR